MRQPAAMLDPMTERYLDDALLIARAREGDRSAFDALVQKHEVRAYQYAYRLTRHAEEAADLVSEGFLRVFNALPNFKGTSSFQTWLYRIMTNCFLDRKKRDKSKRNVSLEAVFQTAEGSELGRQIEDPSRGPQEETERNQREASFEAAVGKLADYQRAMIVMYHAEMMSYEEIAAALDMPVGTVKSRLNRARLTLREMLAKDEELFRI
jgi:RNA polymerase sigma-70 factor (ECF subfamily)